MENSALEVVDCMTSSSHRLAENSLGKTNWRTPLAVFRALDKEFNFTLDAAASRSNALCAKFIDYAMNAFRTPWIGRVFCNPPYGRDILDWHQRAHQQVQIGNAEIVVMLVPANTDTQAFHYAMTFAHEIRLVKGRIRFVGPGKSPPSANAIVIYRPGKRKHLKVVGFDNPQKRFE